MDAIRQLFRSLPESEQDALAQQLAYRLADGDATLTESRARVLLHEAAGVESAEIQAILDEFVERMREPAQARLALFDVIQATGLEPARPGATADAPFAGWLTLGILAGAHQVGYHAADLDPSHPPAPHSPAGRALGYAIGWINAQLRRNAIERDRQLRRIAYDPVVATPPPTSTQPEGVARGTIPVRYFEYNEAIAVDSAELDTPPPPVTTSPVRITEDDLPALERPLEINVGPSRRIARPQAAAPDEDVVIETDDAPSIRQALSENLPEVRDSVASTAAALAGAVRARFRNEAVPTVRLRVVVQDKPDGTGLPAVQVKISSPGFKNYVAGTTNPEGVFIVDLPVRDRAGMMYHADVVWPAQFGGTTERKSITLNTHRDAFMLVFYHRVV